MGWCTAWERKSMLGAYWRPLAVWVCGEQVRPCGLPFSCRLMPVSGVWWLFGRAEDQVETTKTSESLRLCH